MAEPKGLALEMLRRALDGRLTDDDAALLRRVSLRPADGGSETPASENWGPLAASALLMGGPRFVAEGREWLEARDERDARSGLWGREQLAPEYGCCLMIPDLARLAWSPAARRRYRAVLAAAEFATPQLTGWEGRGVTVRSRFGEDRAVDDWHVEKVRDSRPWVFLPGRRVNHRSAVRPRITFGLYPGTEPPRADLEATLAHELWGRLPEAIQHSVRESPLPLSDYPLRHRVVLARLLRGGECVGTFGLFAGLAEGTSLLLPGDAPGGMKPSLGLFVRTPGEVWVWVPARFRRLKAASVKLIPILSLGLDARLEVTAVVQEEGGGVCLERFPLPACDDVDFFEWGPGGSRLVDGRGYR